MGLTVGIKCIFDVFGVPTGYIFPLKHLTTDFFFQ